MRLLTSVSALLLALNLAAGFEPPVAALFAEGVISTPDDESALALTPDGKTAFFGKTSPTTTGDPMRVICLVHSDGHSHWGKPEIAPFSGKYHDLGPALKPDGSRLYFVSDRPTGATEKHDLDIWYVDRLGSGWSDPHALDPPINSPANEYGVSVAANGTLYFASSRPGGKGSSDLYRAKLENGQYKTVENLGDAINTPGPEVQPAISPDESILVFTASGRDDETIGVHKTYAHGDLYVSFQNNGIFSPARHCPTPINSGGGESWPAFSTNGLRLFFTSDRGFATYRLKHRMDWADLHRALLSTLNGMGNIWQVPATALR